MFSWKTIEICFAKVHTQKYAWVVMGKDQIDLKKWQLAPILKSWSTGMIGNWAPRALYHSVLRSWTGNIFLSEVEIHHFLHWKCVLFQSLQKANFDPCLTISKLISLEVIPFNSYPKRQKALDKTMFKFKSTSNSLHKPVWWKINICNSDRCTEFNGSGTKYQIQWVPREYLKFLKVLHYPMFHKTRTDL